MGHRWALQDQFRVPKRGALLVAGRGMVDGMYMDVWVGNVGGSQLEDRSQPNSRQGSLFVDGVEAMTLD